MCVNICKVENSSLLNGEAIKNQSIEIINYFKYLHLFDKFLIAASCKKKHVNYCRKMGKSFPKIILSRFLRAFDLKLKNFLNSILKH